MKITDEAVEAAVEAHCEGTMRAALEAAAPHMLNEAKAAAWDECEAAKCKIRLNASGNAWEAVKENPYRSLT